MLFGYEQWPGGQNLMSTPKIYRQLFEIIPSPNFGLNFAPRLYVWQGLDYVKSIYYFSDLIFHVHFQDITLFPEQLAECGVLAYPSLAGASTPSLSVLSASLWNSDELIWRFSALTFQHSLISSFI